MQTRLVPFDAPAEGRLRQLERDFTVSLSSIEEKELPLRSCGKRVRRLSFQIEGPETEQALSNFDNWLEALGIF